MTETTDDRRAGSSSAGNDSVLRALLEASSRGSEDAFGDLYDRVAGRIHGLVRRVVNDAAQAEEVTQEVFLEIWQQAGRYDPARGGPMSWMLTIAHRRSVDRVRSARAATDRDEAYERRHRPVDHDATAEQAERRLDASRVQRALDGLTPLQRDAIQLAYYGGFTHTEVASRLDLPLGTAKSRIRDGLSRLKTDLGRMR